MKKYTYSLFLVLTVLLLVSSPTRAQIRPGGINLPQGIPQGGGRPAGGQQGGGAIIDDSTKNIYGPSTALHFYEDDILNNRDSLRYRLDTTLTGIHRWNFVDRSWNHLVDLGNLGTAARQTFYQPRQQVGAQLGFDAYDPYAIQQNEVRYYDTRSPLTEMTFVSGGRGRNLLRFGFNQNITPRLNVGFRVQRFTSNKQYGTFSAVNSQSILGQNWTFITHGNYFSKSGKYILLAHYRHLNHNVKEQGGLLNVIDTLDNGNKL
ncbi:MAG: putative porin, partial [Bacteroidetes bacterium]|nr:putative porin [Bacteroidota bacterium]